MRSQTLRGQSGFTLVELMVAMSIFLLILVGIFQVFDPSSRAYSTTETGFSMPRASKDQPASSP